jgi:adenosylhomocysteine nucleosidase
VIGIFAALRRELKPIKSCFPSLDEFEESGVLFSNGRANGRTVVLVQTGIGWQRALSASRLAAERFPLKLFVSTGFAGGLQDSIRVGDIVIGQKIISLAPISPAGNPIINLKPFLCDLALARLAETAAKNVLISRRGPGVHSGPIVTVERIVARSEEKKEIARKSEAVALDMETAAVANVAEQRHVPFVAVRAVSDVLEEDIEFDGALLLTERGTFRWGAGLRYLAAHPSALSHLNRLCRQSNLAARSLGIFFQEFLRLSNLPGGARNSA